MKQLTLKILHNPITQFSQKPIVRASLIVMAIVGLVGGVTFSALQSQSAVVKGSSISTATANLQVSPDGTTYSNSIPGFSFNNLIPGAGPTPASGYPIFLKNAGSTALALNLYIPGTINFPANVNISKVHLILTQVSTGIAQSFTLADLNASLSTGGTPLSDSTHVPAGGIVEYTTQITMDADAVTGSSTTITDMDLNFGGTTVNS